MIKDIHDEIDRRFPSHLEYVKKFLRQPSISADGTGMGEAAQMVAEMMEEFGAKVTFWGEDGYPVVYGELDLGKKRTLIEYEMYDVQPVGDEKEWMAPPFGAEIRNLQGLGDCVICRGAVNSKGSLACNMMTWKTIQDVDELPVNLKMIAEGEEEVSSRNFIKFVTKNRSKLRADGAFCTDFTQDLRGVPGVYLGAKGCIYLEITSRGNEKGGPTMSEIHSSDGVWISSPLWRLIKALNSLVDDQQEPAIDGLMKHVRKPTETDKKMVKELAKSFDEQSMLRELGAKRYKYDLHGEELLMKYLFNPLVNVDGIHSGFTEERGTKTVLPHKAFARIDIRLVPNMSVDGTMKKLRAHLARRGFEDLEIKMYDSYSWSRVSPRASIVQRMIKALRYHGYQPEIWPTSGGTAPFFVFDRILKIPWVYSGLGHGGRAHAPNEYATVEGMKLFEKGQATFIHECAK